MPSPYHTINGISNALPTQAANTSEDIGQVFAFDFDPTDLTHMVRLIEGVIAYVLGPLLLTWFNFNPSME